MMRTICSCLFILLLSFGLLVQEASAKRFGGGRSFGMQRSHSSFSSYKPHNTATSGQKTNTKRWGGLLGGLLVGGLLASLFMGHGLANGLITWLILGSLLFFLLRFFRRSMQPAMQSGSGTGWQQNIRESAHHNTSTLADFIPEAFLRQAKVSFVRLQTAYDQKNLQDLSSFTAPEVFAEIKMQLAERGNEPNTTEVLHLEAELLDASQQSGSMVASVRFTGSIKENGEINSLNEVWHFRQFAPSNEWLVGGIQQN